MQAKNLYRLAGMVLLAAPAFVRAAEQTAQDALGAAKDTVHEAAGHATEAAGHAVEAADSGGGLLSPNQGTAFWTLLLFVLLLVVLGKLVWPKITSALDAREGKIRGDIDAAEAANAKAQKTLADYQKQLAEAHAETRKLIDQARKDGEALRHRMVGETEAEIAKLRTSATQEIKQAKQQAVSDLYATASELSVAVASKILQRQINDQDTARLVEQSLTELDRLKAN